MRGEFPVQNKVLLLIAGFVVALLLGFSANPAPQPQRVSDLVARIENLEEENGTQQELLEALSARVDALEASGGGATSVPTLAEDVEIPEAWVDADSSDGIIRYWHDPQWELASDEPGTMDLWLDEDTAIFFTWDWAYDLVDDLHNDEDFLRIFEEDLIWSDNTLRMREEDSGSVDFMGEDALYWEISVEALDEFGYSSRMLTIFYPCSELTSCAVSFVRFDPDPDDDDELVDEFSSRDWEFVNTFANGVEFLTEGEATVTANANLRECPAIRCEIVGWLVRGVIVKVVAVTEDGRWFQLESGEWIASSLVNNAPSDLPVVSNNEDI
jgi:hypothetical protein